MNPLLAPRIYIRNFAGLGNRIESLAIAQALRATGGHELVLDWPELDLLTVAGSQRARLPWWRRVLRHKPSRLDTDQAVAHAAQHSTIDLRRIYGDAPVFDHLYPQLAGLLGIKPQAAQQIQRCFDHHATAHPVVGMHIRRGDFSGADASVYAPDAHSHTAVPLWWYLGMMAHYRARYPQVRFFAALNGRREDFPEFSGCDDVFTLEAQEQSVALPAGHESGVHPVADLFALACCTTVLATPGSSFSHIAVNVLGPQASALVPVAGARADQVDFARVALTHQRLDAWNTASRGARADSNADLPTPQPADTAWLTRR